MFAKIKILKVKFLKKYLNLVKEEKCFMMLYIVLFDIEPV